MAQRKRFSNVGVCFCGVFLLWGSVTAMAQTATTEEVTELLMQAQEHAQDGNIEEALAAAEKALEIAPDNGQVVMLATQLYFQQGVEMADDDRKAASKPLMKGVKLMRKYAEGKERLNSQEQALLALAVYNEACCYAVDGETEKALDSLEEAVELGFRNMSHIRSDSDLDSLREEARYKALMEGNGPAGDNDDDGDDDGGDSDS